MPRRSSSSGGNRSSTRSASTTTHQPVQARPPAPPATQNSSVPATHQPTSSGPGLFGQANGIHRCRCCCRPHHGSRSFQHVVRWRLEGRGPSRRTTTQGIRRTPNGWSMRNGCQGFHPMSRKHEERHEQLQLLSRATQGLPEHVPTDPLKF